MEDLDHETACGKNKVNKSFWLKCAIDVSVLCFKPSCESMEAINTNKIKEDGRKKKMKEIERKWKRFKKSDCVN
jgi:hypothetical protein